MLVFHVMTAGAVFCGIGIIVRYLLGRTLNGAVPVTLEVVKVHEDEHSNSFTPEFEITAGTYKGRRCQSGLKSSIEPHRIGELVNGYFNPVTEEIESLTTVKFGRRLAYGLIIGGSLIFLAGLAFLIRP